MQDACSSSSPAGNQGVVRVLGLGLGPRGNLTACVCDVKAAAVNKKARFRRVEGMAGML
jgi:hypothetical protein